MSFSSKQYLFLRTSCVVAILVLMLSCSKENTDRADGQIPSNTDSLEQSRLLQERQLIHRKVAVVDSLTKGLCPTVSYQEYHAIVPPFVMSTIDSLMSQTNRWKRPKDQFETLGEYKDSLTAVFVNWKAAFLSKMKSVGFHVNFRDVPRNDYIFSDDMKALPNILKREWEKRGDSAWLRVKVLVEFSRYFADASILHIEKKQGQRTPKAVGDFNKVISQNPGMRVHRDIARQIRESSIPGTEYIYVGRPFIDFQDSPRNDNLPYDPSRDTRRHFARRYYSVGVAMHAVRREVTFPGFIDTTISDVFGNFFYDQLENDNIYAKYNLYLLRSQ